MFQDIRSLLAGGPLTLNLTANSDGTISVLVLPKGEGALATPLLLTATAEELDAQFSEAIGKYVMTRNGLAEQVEATNAVMEAAKKESAAKATKAITKSAQASTVKDKGGDDDPDDEEGDPSEPSSPAAQESGSTLPNLFA